MARTRYLKAMLSIIMLLSFSSAGAAQASGGWVQTGSMMAERYGTTAVLLKSGKVLVAGGITTGSQILSTAEIYDPSTGTWSQTGSMNMPRTHSVAILLRNGRVLVA